MGTVSYELIKLNAPVTIECEGLVVQMLYRDFRKLVSQFGCLVSDDDSLIIGPNKTMEISVLY